MSLGFDVISVKKMTTNRRSSAEGTTTVNLPLFLTTLPRTTKSQDIFNLSSLCHIAIKIERYKVQNVLTQCYNCQKFGHVWVNCRQPPHCMWCWANHLHKDCPEKENTSSTPTCCNSQLAEGETAHPSNYRGCRHAKEEMQERKSQRTPTTTTGGMLSSKLITSTLSFTVDSVTGLIDTETSKNEQQQERGQSVRDQNVNSLPSDNILRASITVQQIMTEFKNAESEQSRVMAITKIVL
jgi:hypothetical protein